MSRPSRAVSRRGFLVGAVSLSASLAASGAVLGACSDDGDGSGQLVDATTGLPEPATPTGAAAPTGTAAATTADASPPDTSPVALTPTPTCDDEQTSEQTEGPFYSPGVPEKPDFRADVDHGDPMVLTGVVVDTACTPIADTVIDVWHADADGVYDNETYRLRGFVRTDDAGVFRIATIVPGLYPGRTRHFHVKVAAPSAAAVLTTQLYFPDEPSNDGDGIFRPELLMAVVDAVDPAAGPTATFTFVIAS